MIITAEEMKEEVERINQELGDIGSVWTREDSEDPIWQYDIEAALLNRPSAEFIIRIEPKTNSDIVKIQQVFANHKWNYIWMENSFNAIELNKVNFITSDCSELFTETLESTRKYVNERINKLFGV
jgi:hypothetical protein